MARRWTTPEGLAFEGEQTGDGRIFVPGAFSWDGDSWPLRYDQEDDGGHAGAVMVGSITSLARGDEADGVVAIMGEGEVDDDSEMGAEVVRLLDQDPPAPLGASVDLDDIELEWVMSTEDADEEEVILFAASFPQATLTRRPWGLAAAGGERRMVWQLWAPGVGRLQSSIYADLGAPLTAAAGDGDVSDDDSIVLFTDATDMVLMRFTRARIRGATLLDIGAFDRAGIALEPIEGADAEGDALAALAAAAEPCDECTERAWAHARAAVVASGDGGPVPMRPPAAWFETPRWAADEVVAINDPESGRKLRGVPMRYLDSGEVRGHIALWGECHTGSPDGACVLTPRSHLNYVPFHHGAVELDDGTLLPVGNLTMAGGHAGKLLSYAGTIEHYDDVATMVAQVRAGEDEYGVWVHGAGMPDVWTDDLQMRRLRAASPSGDWRTVGAGLELTAALAVCHPGFPVPRAMVAASGEVLSLVAAGARDVALLTAAASGGPRGQRLASIVQQAVQAGIEGFLRQQAEQAAAAAEAERAAEAAAVLDGIRRERAVAVLTAARS